jgi:hypothetical protein
MLKLLPRILGDGHHPAASPSMFDGGPRLVDEFGRAST